MKKRCYVVLRWQRYVVNQRFARLAAYAPMELGLCLNNPTLCKSTATRKVPDKPTPVDIGEFACLMLDFARSVVGRRYSKLMRHVGVRGLVSVGRQRSLMFASATSPVIDSM